MLKLLTGTNQTLENIKMAYWWAGYYSGLYEAQQQPTLPNGSSTNGKEPNI